MQNNLTPILAKAVMADIDRRVAAPRRASLLRRLRTRRAGRTQQLVPAPVRIQRPATW